MIVVIPAYNEESTIESIVEKIIETFGCPVIVVDDGSSDRTAQKAFKGGAVVISHKTRLGAWSAIQTGLFFAWQRNIAPVITLDADGQHDPKDIAILMDAYRQTKADLIIGSCPQRVSVLRKIAWHFFRLIANIDIKDITSGFRLYSSKALQILADKKHLLIDYQDIGILIVLKQHGLRIKEIPVRMYDRRSADGCSRVFANWRMVFKYMIYSTILAVSKKYMP